MSSFVSENLVPILIALVIGVLIAWWLFRRPATSKTEAPRVEHKPAMRDGSEGNSLADEHAAAAADIAGQFMGVDVHAQIPGASGPPDNLRRLKGVGPKLADKLNENGITRYDQLAALTPAQAAALDLKMDPFKGRIARDRLIEQAGFLARGDTEGFESRFGNLGSDG
jgi:predicted flap endonuclease-1-like 5' DNA nuclease